MLGAQRRDQLAGGGLGTGTDVLRQRGRLDQRGQAFGFRTAVSRGDCLAQRRLRGDRRCKIFEGQGAEVVCGVFCAWLIDLVPLILARSAVKSCAQK